MAPQFRSCVMTIHVENAFRFFLSQGNGESNVKFNCLDERGRDPLSADQKSI
jgi:hypothetical protein